MDPLADALDDLVTHLLRAVVGDGWGGLTEPLLRLDRHSGGCGVPRVQDRAHTAFLAAVLRSPPPARAGPQAWAQAGITPHVRRCLEWLRERGVHLDDWAMPHRLPPEAGLTPDRLPDCALPMRQRGWRRCLAEVQAESLARDVPWLGSRAGEEGGALLTATPSEVGGTITDDVFRAALRFRLGLPLCTDGARCCHRSARSRGTGRCGAALDSLGHHAILCKVGGGPTVTHDACCDRLLGAARAAGFRALREQVVPELASQTRAEPRVDVDAWGLAAAPRVLLDFTVCAPFAAR